MPPKSKKKEEEALSRRRLAQKMSKRRRYNEIKNDPELLEIQRKMRRERYLKQKEKKKELSSREQREQRKRWRENSKRFRQKNKENSTIGKQPPFQTVNIQAVVDESCSIIPDTEATSTKLDDPLHCCPLFESKVRNIRYTELKKRKKILRLVAAYRKRNKSLRKCIQRLKKKLIEMKAEKARQGLNEEQQLESDNSDLSEEKETPLMERIIKFYTEDANSAITAGKKEFITRNKVRKQKRYLCLPLKDLYKKFCSETKLRVSYSFFCKQRPYWVLFPRKINRETCQCAVHVNMELLITGLNKASILNEKNSDQVLSKLCCDSRNTNCLQRKCVACISNHLDYNNDFKNKNVTYFQWVKVTKNVILKNGTAKMQVISEKKSVSTRFTEAVAKMEHDIIIFLEHIYRIVGQYKQINSLKENLNIQECLIHVDFSENYSLKYAEEVQSFHFGGSRQQVSLHTAVAYVHNFHTGLVTPTSMCTISECLMHNAPSIWAHLVPLIEEVIKLNPLIDTIHFLSDSPSSQYRNKNMFYIITQIYTDFPELSKITWNYSEAGHGKGAPDGVGATLKRTADQMVLYGADVGTFDQFYDLIKGRVENEQLNITIKKIEEKDITLRSNLIPNDIKSFKGTFSVHQVLWDKSQIKLTLRKMSCFECSASQICVHGHHLGHIVNLSAASKHVKEDKTQYFQSEPSTSRAITKNVEILSDVSLNVINTQESQPKASTSKTVKYQITKSENNPKKIKIILNEEKITFNKYYFQQTIIGIGSLLFP